MLRTRHAYRIRRAAAAALFLQLAAISGSSLVEASHNHLGPHAAQRHGQTDDHPGDGRSAHAQCMLCGHCGTCMFVASRVGVVHAVAVHGVRAHVQPNSRLAAVDAGFSTRPRAPPGQLI